MNLRAFPGVGKFFFPTLFLTYFLIPSFLSAQTEKGYISDLDSSTRAVVLSAVSRLSVSSSAAAENALIAKLGNSPDDYVKVQIMEALSVFRSAKAFEAVSSYVDNPNAALRKNAWINLAFFEFMAAEDGVPGFLAGKAGAETNRGVKLAAVGTLKFYKSTETVSVLGDFLSDASEDKVVRKACIRSLRVIGTQEAKTELVKHKNDNDSEIAALATAAANSIK